MATEKPEKSRPKAARPRGAWIDELVDATGRMIRVETLDGVRRIGRLTGLQCRQIQYQDGKEEIPVELEINGDPHDRITIANVRSLNID